MTVRLLHGSEPAVDALIDRLNTQLVEYVDAENARVTDGIYVEAPQQVLRYVPPLDQILTFPTIGIGDAPGRWEDDTGFSATGVYGLTVVWFIQDADQDALTTRARRTMTVLLSCVMEGRQWGAGDGTPWGVRLLGTRPGAALADRPGPNAPPDAYMTWVGIAVEVKLDEE